MANAAETMTAVHPVLAPLGVNSVVHDHLARELHDGVAGELSTMLLDLERFRQAQTGRLSVLAEIAHLQEQVRTVLSNVRGLLYDQRGLPQLDPDFIGSLRRGLVHRFEERTGLRIHVSVAEGWPAILRADTARNLHRIVQEALNNVDRHSGARSVLIRFGHVAGTGMPVLKVIDDGRGYPNFDGGMVSGLGLLGIRERASLLGAEVSVTNRRRGGGVLTVVFSHRSLGL